MREERGRREGGREWREGVEGGSGGSERGGREEGVEGGREWRKWRIASMCKPSRCFQGCSMPGRIQDITYYY